MLSYNCFWFKSSINHFQKLEELSKNSIIKATKKKKIWLLNQLIILKSNIFRIAVIGVTVVFGTTQEGAVDDLNKLLIIREYAFTKTI